MLILLDCRPLQYASDYGEKNFFILSCTTILSRLQDVKWWFLVDGSYEEGQLPGLPADRIVQRKALPGLTGWKMWYEWHIPAMVKKLEPDLVITTGSRTATRLTIPQCLWLLEGIEPASSGKKKTGRIDQKGLAKSLADAAVVFTFSEKDKNFLTGLPAIAVTHAKILVVSGAPEEGYRPFTVEEREKVKSTYAAGKEYFLADVTGASSDQRVNLLKAFSLFKKRQLSNMQLVLAGKNAEASADFEKKLETYKYRADIHLTGALSQAEWISLMGGAYGFLFPFPAESLGTPVLNAWKAGVPVITSANGYLPELTGDRVLLAKPGDPASLAGHLMTIYKDEGLRSSLIEKGKDRLPDFTRDAAVEKVWSGINRALGKEEE
jgi:hypothetical protein